MAMLRDFKGMPRFQQFVLAAAGALVLFAILGAIWLFFLRTQYGVLFSDLRPADAAGIVAELDSKKIPYRLAEGGTTILIPADRVDSARLDVTSGDVPLKGQVGFELFNKSDLGLTDFAQKINYQRALQGELARTIMTMDSVGSARVHLSISEHSIFRDDRVPPKASVTIVPRPGHRIPLQAVRGIQRLVAASVPELDPANVVVIGEDGNVLGNDLGQDEGESLERRLVEQKYLQEVRRSIDKIAPFGTQVSIWAGASNRYAEFLSPRVSPDGRATRDFPLEATITVPAPISADEEETLHAAAIAAFVPANAGDSVTIDISPAGLTEAPVAAPTAAPVPAGTPPVRDTTSVALRAGLGAAFLAFVALMLFPRMRRRSLSEAQRTRYAETFKSLLEGEQADA